MQMRFVIPSLVLNEYDDDDLRIRGSLRLHVVKRADPSTQQCPS